MIGVGRDGRCHVQLPNLPDFLAFSGLCLMFDDECKCGHCDLFGDGELRGRRGNARLG